MQNMSEEILVLKNLKTYFLVDKHKKTYVRAVDDVSFSINKGEIVGLVGESGSGKSTIAYTIMGMNNPSGGEIIFDGENIIAQNNNKRTFDFKKKAQIVFQDPGSSLNPYQDVKQILSLPLKVHKVVSKNKIDDKISEILGMVGLSSDFMYKSPTSIGGGEKQLVSIARALCSSPKFILLDEPTSSLDVSIQAKIINMLLKLHKEQGLTYLFITHDLSLVRNISTKVVIMYLGKICEIAQTEEFYRAPLHPYTQMLLSSIPVISDEEEELKPKKVVSKGEIPSPVNIPKGCSFNTRCNQAMDICFTEDPIMHQISDSHQVRCHLFK
ncbi:ABC transporter ATP-binding protein [Clostridium sp.]|uniref:oligopeptide/dipeptide ABC transporter ATP-binding protein n=1 Tax=Clostridium sp. TaxID=1506 RepID=UPI0025C702C5|nr:ABC transporter ATP-binding protein [Clostridium sp.]